LPELAGACRKVLGLGGQGGGLGFGGERVV
jgi:hypothetical protein